MPSEAFRGSVVDRLAAALAELQQLERELVEQGLLRRAEGLQRANEAVRRLGGVGSPAGVLARAAQELGEGSDFDRVLVSRIVEDRLHPVVHWCRDQAGALNAALAELESSSVALRYPHVEAEVVQRQRGELVVPAIAEKRGLPELREAVGWSAYVVTPIRLEGEAVGLLHADRTDAFPPLDGLDLECAILYAEGFGRAYERSVLREKLRRQRQQLKVAAQWINGQSLGLVAEESITGTDVGGDERVELSDALTPRELEVIDLIARGMSNRQIAETLVVGEGTVKYHVKNVLRKLKARSRAEAVSTYMRARGSD